MPTASEFEPLLREARLRVTRPRLAVLSAVHDHPHADTDSLIGVVRADLGEVSHQTVYDVLRVLTQVGLVRRIQPPGSTARYESRVADNQPPPRVPHVRCRRGRRLRRGYDALPDRLGRPRLHDRRGRGRVPGPVPRLLHHQRLIHPSTGRKSHA